MDCKVSDTVKKSERVIDGPVTESSISIIADRTMLTLKFLDIENPVAVASWLLHVTTP